MAIFRGFRRLVDVIEGLSLALERFTRVQEEAGPATDRLTVLELSRHQFEAQMEGLFLKADGKLKAANNSEARERQLKKSYEHLLDPLAPDGDERTDDDAVLPIDAPERTAEELQSLRVGVAPDSKAHAVNAKWGIRNVS